MSSLLGYSLVYLLGVVISSIAQLLLKKAAGIKYDSKLKEYLNFKTMFAYFIFFGATVLSLLSYKGLPLVYGTLLGTTEYIFVTILSYLFLKEKISKKKLYGLILVIVGIILYFL